MGVDKKREFDTVLRYVTSNLTQVHGNKLSTQTNSGLCLSLTCDGVYVFETYHYNTKGFKFDYFS